MHPRLLREVKSVRVLMGLVVLQGVLSGLLIIYQAYDLADIINRVYIGHEHLSQVQYLLGNLLAVIGLRALLTLFGESGALSLATRIQSRLRLRLSKRILNAGPLYINREHAGELVNTLTKGVEDLEPYLARYIPQVAITALVPTIILIDALVKDWITGVILLVTLPLIPFFMILIGRQAESKTQKQWQLLSRLSAHFLDILQGLTTLKLMGQSVQQAHGIERASDEFRRATMSSLRIAFLSALVLELLASLSMAMVAVAIGLRLISGLMAFRTAFFLLVLVPEFYIPWRALGTRFHDGLGGMEAVKRIFQILDAPQPITAFGTRKLSNLEYSLKFENVGFTYEGRESPAVEGMTACLHAHERIAIVGPTGSGKTTVLSLLMGFAHPTTGLIRLGEVPFDDLDIEWWRTQVSFLTQNPYIFSGTLRDNLLMAKADATDEELKAALDMSGAMEFVRHLPQGIESPVGERGRGLSGGQKQRLALARAFLKDVSIVLMDEPTANLDAQTEALLWKDLEKLLTGRTALVVAHRLSTARRLDRIWVMNQGHLVQEGTARELESVSGLYRELSEAYRAPGKEGEGLYAALSGHAETL